MRSTWPSSILRQQYLHQVNLISHSGHGSLSPLQAEGVKSVSLLVLGLQQPQVSLPLVADDLAAGEAADRDDHDGDDGCLWSSEISLLFNWVYWGNI